MQFNHVKNSTLDVAVAAETTAIDFEAGEARARHITTVPGQEAVYLGKAEQAKSYMADVSPTLADYPYIEAQANALSVTPLEAAQLIDSVATSWVPISANIEFKRIQAKAAINNLPNTATPQDVLDISYPAKTYLRGL